VDAIVDAVGALIEGVANAISIALKAVGVFILIGLWVVASGFIARDYWNWFVAPLGMPRIGLFHAFGLTLFVTFLRTDYSKTAPRDEDEGFSIGPIIGWFLGLGLMWGFGWLIVAFGGPF
jgi:hypothetical protein